MNKREKLKHCFGCRQNFYNGNNDLGVKECWSLESAKMIWRKQVSIHQRPPWDQKAERFMSCYQRQGYVYVGPKQTH